MSRNLPATFLSIAFSWDFISFWMISASWVSAA